MFSNSDKKILVLALSFVLVLSFLVGAEELTILHTNDIHGNYLPKEEGIGGFKALSHYISEARSESEGPTFLFDAGDVMTGTPLTHIEFHGAKGGAVFEMMNFLGTTPGPTVTTLSTWARRTQKPLPKLPHLATL
ncbi:MAG: hypothetical protein ACLFSX_04715 [Candidatus Acetothermia bacterium]